MSEDLPIIQQHYNQRLEGVYGEFGAGANVHAFYVQSAITPQQLNWVSLISNVRGSERWPVRDLFQRDVDNDRITTKLLPYLQDEDKIKFFNPLTLTVLPMHEDTDSILTRMPRVVEYSQHDENGREWVYLERERYYQVRWVKDHPQFALLEWSDVRSRLVAIDGQHRLSALKRFLRDEEESSRQDFMKWRIPVVVVSFRAGAERADPPSVLEVVRSIFVYINTQAQQVSAARKILLADESVNAICTQELLQRSHTNDLAPAEGRDDRCLPLLFYDWRGEEDAKRRVHAPAAVKNVQEVHNWFEWYILGEDFSDYQETALDIDPGVPSLHQAFHDERLNHVAAGDLRQLLERDLLPALSHVLENFLPYHNYAAALRALEYEYENNSQSDLARHAFYDLRFGTNLADEDVRPRVDAVCEEIKGRIEAIKREWFHTPIDLDIGMRAVVSAFGYLYSQIEAPDWMEYAERFTGALNGMYEGGWLDLRERAAKRDYLLHIAEDHNEAIINYRLEHVRDALGCYVELFVGAYGAPWPDQWTEDWPALMEDRLETLRGTIRRGYRKQLRPRLKEEYPHGGTALTEAVNRESENLAGRQIRRIERALENV